MRADAVSITPYSSPNIVVVQILNSWISYNDVLLVIVIVATSINKHQSGAIACRLPDLSSIISKWIHH